MFLVLLLIDFKEVNAQRNGKYAKDLISEHTPKRKF